MAIQQLFGLPGAIRDRITGGPGDPDLQFRLDDETDIEAALPEPFHESVVIMDAGRALGYAEFGDPDGDVVFWFHGTPGARRQIPPDIVEQATVRGFRVIGIERPGTGLSTAHSYGNVLAWADDLEVVADALGVDRFATCGLSGGGPYVLAACHRMPERVTAGAVLGGIGPTRGDESAPGYTRLLPPFEPLFAFMRIPLGEMLTHLIRPVRTFASQGFDLYTAIAPKSDRPIMQQPAMKAMFIHDMVTAAEGGVRAPLGDLVVFGRDWGFSLRDIEVPVRFWHGDADGIVPLSHGEHQSSLVPGADLVVCPGGGHFAGFILAPDVLDWIDDVWTDREHGGSTVTITAV